MNATRREFLAGTLAAGTLAAGAVTAAASVLAEKNAPPWKCGLGLNGFMSSGDHYKKTYPIWEILDFASKEGFDGVELVENWPMGPLPGPDDAQRIAALKRFYDCYGLRIYSLQTGGGTAYSADANARKEWLKEFQNKVRLGKQLGFVFIGNWPGGGLEGNKDVTAAIKNLASSYREAAKMCADAGMYLSFEIEPPFLFNTLEHLQQILVEVNHPACKTNFDVSHFDLMSGAKGHPEEMLKKLGVPYIGHVHLTDTDGTIFGGTSKHLPCGEGHCDIEAALTTLWEGGYDGWIMIDAWLTEDPYHASHQGIQAIKTAEAHISAVLK